MSLQTEQLPAGVTFVVAEDGIEEYRLENGMKVLLVENRVAPVATNRCGTFLAFMYFWIAVFDGVPSGWKISSTSSLSTSLRACSTALGGL